MPKKKINYKKKKFTEILAWAMNVFIYLFISCLCTFMIVCSWFDKCTDRTDRLICIKFHGNVCMIVRSPNPEDFISVQSLRTELVKFAKYTRGRHKPVQYTKKDICWAFAS